MEPGHDGTDGDVHDLGDLLVGETLHIGQQHREAEVLGQVLDGSLDVRFHEALQYLLLGASGRAARFGTAEPLVQVEILELAHLHLGRATQLLAVAVDVGVGEDPVQPRLEVGAGLEGVVGPVGLEKRLLHHVLGVGGVAGHPQGRRVELRGVLHRVSFEVLLVCHRYDHNRSR